MIFTLVPTAMAEGEMAEAPAMTKVAKVGDQEYATLAEAVAAAESGATVTLLKDAELTETLNINKAITLDGANHKITGKPSTGKTSFITVETDGNFTMKNATILPTSNVEANAAIDLQVKGKVVVDSCVFGAADDTNQFMYNGLEFSQNEAYPMADETTISNCTFYGGSFRHNFISFYRMADGATININGNKFLNANWNDTNAIRVSNYSNVNATINLLDDTYSDHGDDEYKAYAGLLCFQELSSYNDNFTKLTVNIEKLDTTGAQSDQLFYVYKDSIISTNQPVVKGDSSIEKFFVAKVDDTYYKTLAEAVAAAKNDETVTLLKNAETTVELSFTNKAITLDLNGKTVSGTFTDNFSVIEAGEDASLTVQDTSVAGTGKIASNKYGISARDGGALIVKSGTIESEYAPLSGNNTAGDMNFTVNGGTLTAKHGPAIYMPGQVNLSITDGVLNGGISLRMGQVSISGGTINAATDGLDSPAEYYHYSGNAWLPDALYVFGGTYTSENTTYGNSLHLNITGGTFNCANGQGSAVAIYDLGKVEQVMEITISDEAKLGTNSTARNAYDKLSLSDIGVTSPEPGFGAHSGQVSTTITGGLFSSDPSAYVADDHYVDASNNGDYPYTVKEGTKPAGALIVVKDTTAVTVPDSEAIKDLTNDDKTNIANKSSVDGVAEAIADNKADLIPADVNTTDAKKVEIEVTVKVNVTSADMTSENKTLTFEASPVATVTVTKADGSTEVKNDVKVPNSLLNGQPITVKLPLPANFEPEQIKHISSDGSVEYFLKTAKRGANTFEIKDGCAVFTITKFSTFELSGTVTYVEPSYYSGSSSAPTYSVTVDKTENGSVTVSPKSASKGDTVTVTVKPDSGYVLETLTVTDKNGNELTLKDKGDGKYTFTMPGSKVEVKATFMEDNSVLNFFYDVPNDAYFYEAVKWAVKNGITTGVGNDLFAPEQPCTRAQIVTFLWRAAGSPEPKTASSFTDVPANAYYAKAVAWAVENGITNGMTETTFAPDATCTRGQSVTFLYRALKGTASGSANFTDVASDAFYADAVNWAVANNVTNGTSNTTFSPNADCTRAEIVTFLYRAYQGK